MARKAKLDSHKGSSPLTAEQVFRLDNVMKHGTPPKALQSLKSSNSFTFVDAPGDLKVEKLIHKVSLKDGKAAYQIENKYGLAAWIAYSGVHPPAPRSPGGVSDAAFAAA
jgi:hypothetical protein